MANDVKITISGRDNASPVFAGVKQQALGFGLALVGVATAQQALKGAITGTLGAAISFETSFAGIRKTMELSEADFKRLSDANRNLAKTMPITANEFNKIGELAGQLGIKGVKNVLSFEKTIAKLAVTTNLTSEEAALSFAQIANVMKIPQDQIANMGAGVVALGNKFATTERDIVAFTQRIAGAGAIVGLTTGDVLGISTALSSIGVNAEAGGTAVQKVLLEMQKAVSTNSDELKIFAEVADVSVKEFARLFEEDASEAFIGFIEGLTSYGKDGVQVLDALGLADQRLTRAFLGLAAAGDITKRAIDEGNKSVTENTALNEEAERRFKTTASQISILKNNFRDMGIEIGTVALPAIVELSSQGVRFLEDLKVAFGNVKQAVKDLNSSIKEFIGFSPFEFVINMTVNGLGSLDSPRAVLQNIGEAADNVRRSMGNMFSNAAGGISGGIAGIPQSLKNLQDVFTSAGGLGIGGTGLIDPRGPIVKLRPDIFPPEILRCLGNSDAPLVMLPSISIRRRGHSKARGRQQGERRRRWRRRRRRSCNIRMTSSRSRLPRISRAASSSSR